MPLITQMNWLINQEEDWRILLKTSANQLCQRLGVFRFLLLQWDQDRQQFDILYQTPSLSRRLIQAPLPPLGKIEQQILQQQQIIALENWEESQLQSWEDAFRLVGVRSLLITPMDTAPNTSPTPLKALLVIAHDAPRTWEQSEKILGATNGTTSGVKFTAMAIDSTVARSTSGDGNSAVELADFTAG
jgi:hypothetical protein